MSSETEIERLVVRLVGDDSSYRKMMENAATESGKLNSVDNEVAKAQQRVRDATKESSESFRDHAVSTSHSNKALKLLVAESLNLGAALSGLGIPVGDFMTAGASVIGTAMRMNKSLQALSTVSHSPILGPSGSGPKSSAGLDDFISAGTKLNGTVELTRKSVGALRGSSTLAAASVTTLGSALGAAGVAAAAVAPLIGIAYLHVLQLESGARQSAKALENVQLALKKAPEVAERDVTGNLYAAQHRSLQESTAFARLQYEKQEADLDNSLQARAAMEEQHRKDRKDLKKLGFLSRLGADAWTEFSTGKTGGAARQLADQEAADKAQLDQTIRTATSKKVEAEQRYISSLKDEVAAMAAANSQGKTYIDTKHAEIASLEQIKQLMLSSNIAMKSAEATAYQNRSTSGADYAASARMTFEWNEALKNGFKPTREEQTGHEKASLAVFEQERQVLKNRIDLTLSARKAEDEAVTAQIRNADLRGVAAARQSAIDKALIQNERERRDAQINNRTAMPDIDAQAAGETAAMVEASKQMAVFQRQAEDAALTQKYFAAEMAASSSPMNEQAMAALKVAKAYEAWAKANDGIVATEGVKQKQLLMTAAAQELMLKYAQEGRAAQEKFMEPLDRVIQSQARLREMNELGVFGKGEKGKRVYEKAMAEEYGRAHKEYTSQFMGQQYDAMIGGTNQADRALMEYRMGSTAIPADMINAEKERQKEAEKNDPTLAPIKEMRDSMKTLVDMQKSKKTLEVTAADL